MTLSLLDAAALSKPKRKRRRKPILRVCGATRCEGLGHCPECKAWQCKCQRVKHAVTDAWCGPCEVRFRAEARWPGAREREILCLGCDRPFKSEGRANRMCSICRSHEASWL